MRLDNPPYATERQDKNDPLHLADMISGLVRKSNSPVQRKKGPPLFDVARKKGVAGFTGEVLKINKVMLHILKTLPYKIYFESEEDCLFFQFHFDQLKKDFE